MPRLSDIIDEQTLEDPLFGYRKVQRHEIDTIKKGSLVRYKNGNNQLRYGGYVVDVKNANVPVLATIGLVSYHYWELRFLACNELYVKDPASTRSAIKNAIGADKMSEALDRVRHRFKNAQ